MGFEFMLNACVMFSFVLHVSDFWLCFSMVKIDKNGVADGYRSQAGMSETGKVKCL